MHPWWCMSRDSNMDRASFPGADHQVHNWLKNHSSWSSQLLQSNDKEIVLVLQKVLVFVVWGRLIVDQFAIWLDKKPQSVSPFTDPMAWKENAFQHSWDHLHTNTLPPFALICQVLNRVLISSGFRMTLVALYWPQQEWYSDLSVRGWVEKTFLVVKHAHAHDSSTTV